MKVVLLHWALPPTVGGVESYLVDTINGLSAVGAKVVLVSGERWPSRQLMPPGVRFVYDEDLDVRRHGHSVPAVRRASGKLETTMREVRPHVVHTHNLLPVAPGVADALVRLREELGYSLFHTSHSYWRNASMPPPRERDWDGLFAVSGHLSARLTADGWPAEHVPMPINVGRFDGAPPVLTSSEVRVLLPGRLVPEKGAAVAVMAVQELRGRGVSASLTLTDTPTMLDFSGGNHAHSQRLLHDLAGLVRSGWLRVERAGWQEMPGLYQRADLVVCPSVFAEPFGMVVPEAMSSRRPVVASDAGGLREAIAPGSDGLLVAPGDPRALADALEALVKRPELARCMGKRGQARAAVGPTPIDHAEWLLARYRKVGQPAPSLVGVDRKGADRSECRAS